MWALGDKIASSIVAQTADVPTLPWSGSGGCGYKALERLRVVYIVVCCVGQVQMMLSPFIDEMWVICNTQLREKGENRIWPIFWCR